MGKKKTKIKNLLLISNCADIVQSVATNKTVITPITIPDILNA